MASKAGEIGHALSQGKNILGVLIVEDDSVVQKFGDISESVVNHFLKLVNVGISGQLVRDENFQTMNVIYPYKCSYTIGVAGKRIYITKRSVPSAPDDEDESRA